MISRFLFCFRWYRRRVMLRRLTQLISIAVLAVPAFAQYEADTLRGKPPCTATRTTNCIGNATPAGTFYPSIAGTGDVQGAGNLTVAGRVAYVVSGSTLGSSAGLAFNSATNSLGVIGDVTIGQTGTATGQLKLNGTTSGTAIIKPPDAAGTPTFTLPTASGTFIVTTSAPSTVVGLFNSGTCSGYLKSDGSCDTPTGGSGDVTGPASSVDNEVALFSGTGGKTIKRASLTGIPYLTSGVIGSAVAANVYGLWSGTCNNTTFLRGDGACATPAGSGTVTVVSSGSLTSTALVTGGGTTTLQTPAATATMDSSGNISTPGSITTGAGGSAAGYIEIGQGTAPSAGTTAVTLAAPASVTSYINLLPGAAATGFYLGTNSAGTVTWSQVAPGTGVATWMATPSSANLRSALTDESGTGAAYFQGGDAGTPSAIVLTNATGFPTLNQNTTGTAGGLSGTAITGDVANSGNTFTLATKHKTYIKSMTLFDPVTGDSGRIQISFPTAVTITRVSCSVKAATSATINLDERAEATPDTTGTAVLTSGLACDTDTEVSTTFTNAGIAARVPVALTISAVSGTPDTLRVHVEYTVD
jgi:hypothetical protein